MNASREFAQRLPLENDRPVVNEIRAALAAKRFFWTIEFIPSVDKVLRDELHKLGGVADALRTDALLAGFAVTDRVVSDRDPDPIAAAAHLGDQSGKQPLVHLSGKGRDIGDYAQVLARLHEQGLENVLIVSGDRLKEEPREGRARYLESVSAIDAARRAMPNLLIATAVNPFKYREEDAMAQLFKLNKKVRAGADFAIAQIGWDMQKYHEVLEWIDSRGLGLPLVANIMPLTAPRARYIRQNQLAGVTITDSLLAMLEHEEKALVDRGAARALRRAALQIIGAKLIGCAGVQITGIHAAEKLTALQREVVKVSEQCGDEVAWQRAWLESMALPEGGCADPAPAQAWRLGKAAFVTGGLTPNATTNISPVAVEVPHMRRNKLRYQVMSHIHRFWFEHGLGSRLLGLFCKPVRQRHTTPDRILAGIERAIKGPLFGCENCGTCRLAATQYVCPETCPKGLANGPCGGTTDNLCEFRDRECIHSVKYRIARDAGVLDELETLLAPAVPAAIRKSSSWPVHFRGEGPRVVTLGQFSQSTRRSGE